MKINVSFEVSKCTSSFCKFDCQYLNQIDKDMAYCELFDKKHECKLKRYLLMDSLLNDEEFKAISFGCHIKCK